MGNDKITVIEPIRNVNKKHAEILRDYADRIERGEIRNLIMSIDDANGIEHIFVGASLMEVAGLATRLNHKVNQEWNPS